MPRLKPKYEAFCEDYLICGSATEAAEVAGYSERSSGQQGYRLLHKPAILERLAELRAELVDRECHGDAQLAKLEKVYRAALANNQPAAAARIVEIQTKLAMLLGKAGPRSGERLRTGAEPTRAALTRIARQLGVPVPAGESQDSAT